MLRQISQMERDKHSYVKYKQNKTNVQIQQNKLRDTETRLMFTWGERGCKMGEVGQLYGKG